MFDKRFREFFLNYIKDTSDAVIVAGEDNKVIFISKAAESILPGIKEGFDLSEIFKPDEDEIPKKAEFYEYDADVSYVDIEDGRLFIYKFPKSTFAVTYDYPLAETPYAKILENLASNIYNPLTIIFSAIDLIYRKGELKIADGAIKEFDAIIQNSYKLLKFANNIGAISTISSNDEQNSIKLLNIDSVEFVKKTVESINKAAKKHEFEIRFFAPSGKMFVKADEKRFERILLILLSNAIKVSKGENPIKVSMFETPTHVAISVSDDGEAMNEDTIKKLFLEQSPLYAGSYDLAIAKLYIEQLMGTLVINAEKGKDEKVTFTLPKGSPRESLFQKRKSFLSKGRFEQKYIDLSDIISYKDFE